MKCYSHVSLINDDCLSSSSNIVPRGVDVPMLSNNNCDLEIVKLFDPNFGEKMMDYDFNPYKPLPEPEVTHTLAITRTYSENEKSVMYSGLEILRQSNQLNRYQQSETYKQKAIDLDIYMFEFEHVSKEGKK